MFKTSQTYFNKASNFKEEAITGYTQPLMSYKDSFLRGYRMMWPRCKEYMELTSYWIQLA